MEWDEPQSLSEVSLHIDNTRDEPHATSKITLSAGPEPGYLTEIATMDVALKEAGWLTLRCRDGGEGSALPRDTKCVQIELANHKEKETVRVRGFKAFAASEPLTEGEAAESPGELSRRLVSESVAATFHHLAGEVFGDMLADGSSGAPPGEEEKEEERAPEASTRLVRVGSHLREHVVSECRTRAGVILRPFLRLCLLVVLSPVSLRYPSSEQQYSHSIPPDPRAILTSGQSEINLSAISTPCMGLKNPCTARTAASFMPPPATRHTHHPHPPSQLAVTTSTALGICPAPLTPPLP